MFPRVSVIIPAYNVANTIEDLLKSLANQTFSRQKTEIIVVNDCSTDNTLEILQSMKKDFELRIFSHEINKGLATTRNTGIKNSHGKILIFIDADMIVNDHYIENHVNFHNNKKVAGVVGGILPSTKMKYDKYQKYLYETKRGIKKHSLDKPIPFSSFICGNTSIKRDVIDACGMFDENIKIYGGEDTEFAFRVEEKFPEGLYGTCALRSTHNHYRSFDESLENLENFAEFNIPYIIKKHPEMSKLYGLNFLSGEYADSSIFHRIIGKLVYQKTFYAINKILYKFLPFPISNLFVRPIIAHRLFRGIKKGLNK